MERLYFILETAACQGKNGFPRENGKTAGGECAPFPVDERSGNGYNLPNQKQAGYSMDEEKLNSIKDAFAGEKTIGEEPEEPPRGKSPGLWALWAVLLALALGVLALSLISVRYQERFYPNTRLLGLDVSRLTAAEAAARLAAGAEEAAVTLRDSSRVDICTIPLSAFVTQDDLFAECSRALLEQHRGKGPLAWLDRGDYDYAPRFLASLSEEAVRDVLEETLYGDTPRVSPKDARIVLGEDFYTLEPEEEGNLVDMGRCAGALTGELRAADSLEPGTRTATVESGRVLPAVTTDDIYIRIRLNVMNNYLSTPVSVDFGNGNVYTLSPEDIWSVSDVTLTEHSVICAPDEDLVQALTERLIEEYGVDGVYAKYLHTAETRPYVYYRVEDTGWIMDREGLSGEIYAALANGRGAELAPDYDYTWYWENRYHCGNTFVEISLDNQYLWYFLDGKLLVETPVVTGDRATRKSTHTGFFWIVAMKEDTNLVGPTWNDHVDYWMPFDIPNEIGLHDSSWRDEYGGDIYLTDGSHGCVNTPLEALDIIYHNIKEGVPVIVY